MCLHHVHLAPACTYSVRHDTACTHTPICAQPHGKWIHEVNQTMDVLAFEVPVLALKVPPSDTGTAKQFLELCNSFFFISCCQAQFCVVLFSKYVPIILSTLSIYSRMLRIDDWHQINYEYELYGHKKYL